MSKARVAVLKVFTKELTVTAAAAKYGYSRQHLHRLLVRQTNHPVATRTLSDAVLIDALLAVLGTPKGSTAAQRSPTICAGRRHDVAFCTTDRLMGDLGMNGVAPRPRRSDHDPSQGRPPAGGPAEP